MAVCPVCSEKVFQPSGPQESDVLVIASSPNEDELKFHRQWSGQAMGQYWRKICLEFLDQDPLTWRKCLLNFHPKMTDDCFLVSLDLIKAEVNGKKFIILMGPDACEYFTGMKVSDVGGLEVTGEGQTSMYFPDDARVFAMINPTMAFAKTIGELEFSLSKFKEIFNG